jgi:tRNA(fMet)-specific endonuclease VapC
VSLSYLLDTNTAGFAIRGNPADVLDQLAKVSADQTAISTVTEAELLFGIERRPQSNQLKTVVTRFLEQATILPWDSQAARQYARLRAGLEANGKRMGALDMMIAAQALAEDLVLVTNDHAFSQVAHLRLEDWTRPQGKMQ